MDTVQCGEMYIVQCSSYVCTRKFPTFICILTS